MEKKNIPIGPLVGAFAVGAVAMWIAGFQVFGWVTGGYAERYANDAAEEAHVAALVPLCVAKARVDPAYEATLTEVREASNWDRDNLVSDAGWATLGGAEEPDSDVADACAKWLVAQEA